jgi:hypothetical protein
VEVTADMTEVQYGSLVAYLSYWKDWPGCTLQQAKTDIGITCEDVSVIEQLYKAGWIYDEKLNRVRYRS